MFVIMQFLKSVSLVFLVFLFLGTSEPSETVSCREIIEKMLDSLHLAPLKLSLFQNKYNNHKGHRGFIQGF